MQAQGPGELLHRGGASQPILEPGCCIVAPGASLPASCWGLGGGGVPLRQWACRRSLPGSFWMPLLAPWPQLTEHIFQTRSGLKILRRGNIGILPVVAWRGPQASPFLYCRSAGSLSLRPHSPGLPQGISYWNRASFRRRSFRFEGGSPGRGTTDGGPWVSQHWLPPRTHISFQIYFLLPVLAVMGSVVWEGQRRVSLAGPRARPARSRPHPGGQESLSRERSRPRAASHAATRGDQALGSDWGGGPGCPPTPSHGPLSSKSVTGDFLSGQVPPYVKPGVASKRIDVVP